MNIQEIDKWLKDQYGISYTEMSNEFNSASEMLSKKIKEIERLKTLWETDKQNWACIMYEKEKEIDKLKNNKPDLTNFIKLETAKLNRKREQEKNRLYSENLLLKNDVKGLNNIINELERYINEEYIYDELGMKIFDASKLQDKLQELKGEKE